MKLHSKSFNTNTARKRMKIYTLWSEFRKFLNFSKNSAYKAYSQKLQSSAYVQSVKMDKRARIKKIRTSTVRDACSVAAVDATDRVTDFQLEGVRFIGLKAAHCEFRGIPRQDSHQLQR